MKLVKPFKKIQNPKKNRNMKHNLHTGSCEIQINMAKSTSSYQVYLLILVDALVYNSSNFYIIYMQCTRSGTPFALLKNSFVSCNIKAVTLKKTLKFTFFVKIALNFLQFEKKFLPFFIHGGRM